MIEMRLDPRAFIVLAFLAAACTDDSVDEGTTSQGVVSNNRLSSNRLSSNRLSSNRLSSNRLSSNRLSSNHLQANLNGGVEELIQTPEGQELLSYMVSCALNEGDVLVAPNPEHETNPMAPETLEFPGEIGLAPRWEKHPLDKQGKRWVSACLYARVNANNVTVPISMRGPHKSLATTPEEVQDWPLQEGGFYGDYFRPLDEDIIWIACRGKDQAHEEIGGLADRDCAEPDPNNPGKTICGFTYAGDCGDYDPPASPHACGHFSNKGYWVSCKSTDAFPRHHHDHFSDDNDDGDHDHDDDDNDHDGNHGSGCGQMVFHQVITTFTHD